MRLKRFFVLFAIVGALIFSVVKANAVMSGLQLAGLANVSCIHYRIKGICIRHKHGHIEIGIKIEMWKPVLLIETVKRPFDSNLPIVSELKSAVPSKIASSGSVRSSGDEQLQFNEVHIMSFPFSAFLSLIGNIVPMWCGGLESPFPTLYYLSELDFVNWRQLADEFTLKSLGSQLASAFTVCQIANLGNNLLDLLKFHHLTRKIPHFRGLGNLCMGYWGPTYPRRGWIANQSEVVGSAADAFRAAYWDSDNSQPKVRFLPLPFTPSVNDELQEALPHKSGCIKIGENPALWEYGKLSPNGKYLWIYWKHFTCCKF